jgi:hypothetical protein
MTDFVVWAVLFYALGALSALAVLAVFRARPSVLSSSEPQSVTCRSCGHAPMRQHGYIAHDFMRRYVCPMCNWDTYIADPELRRQKEARIKEGAA